MNYKEKYEATPAPVLSILKSVSFLRKSTVQCSDDLRAIPTRQFWEDRRYNRHYNQRTTANYSANNSVDMP